MKIPNFSDLIGLSRWVREEGDNGVTYRMNCHTPKGEVTPFMEHVIAELESVMGCKLVDKTSDAEKELLERLRLKFADPTLEHAMLTSCPATDGQEARILPKVELWHGALGADICLTITEAEYKKAIDPFLIREQGRRGSGFDLTGN